MSTKRSAEAPARVMPKKAKTTTTKTGDVKEDGAPTTGFSRVWIDKCHLCQTMPAEERAKTYVFAEWQCERSDARTYLCLQYNGNEAAFEQFDRFCDQHYSTDEDDWATCHPVLVCEHLKNLPFGFFEDYDKVEFVEMDGVFNFDDKDPRCEEWSQQDGASGLMCRITDGSLWQKNSEI